MIHLDLFSGIGGFAYAIDQVWENAEHIFVDNDPFCQAVLRKHWPDSPIFGDIRTFTADTISGGHIHGQSQKQSAEPEQQTQRKPIADIPAPILSEDDVQTLIADREYGKWLEEDDGDIQPITDTTGIRCDSESHKGEGIQPGNGTRREVGTSDKPQVDIITGGFPCQPFSQAGQRKGTADDRHLWPEMLRVIREVSPRWVVGENVRGFTNWDGGVVFDQVQSDLEALGYEVLPFILPACAVNAPHRRDRVWIVAHSNGQRLEGWASGELNSKNGNTSGVLDSTGYESGGNDWSQNWVEVATRLCGMDARFSSWLDRYFDDVILFQYGKKGESDKSKALRVLFRAIQSQKVRDAIGRLWEVDGEKVLLSALFALQERIGKQKWLYLEGEETQEIEMRVLPEYDEITRSSQKWGHHEQLARKLTDIVSELPHEVALEVVEKGAILWGAYTSIYSKKVKIGNKMVDGRVQRLKALGNAIVPQVAIQIMKAIKNYEP